MALLACISTVVTFICQPLVNAMQTSLQTQFEGCLTLLDSLLTSLISSRRSAVEEVPVSSSSVVGAEETLSEIQKHLRDDSVGIIGIHGMGGIGKTTLLQKINNDLFESGTRGLFDVVIWVTVSQEVSIPKIQKQIGNRLGLSFSKDGDDALVEEQAKHLFNTLSKKRFLVILDDVWEWLDLVKIGVPLPEGRRNCKVAFTTRLQQVCDGMDAKTVKVNPLDETCSWELFCSKLRTDIVRTNLHIRALAQQVVQKCGGLPLALITVGRAMASRRLSGDWEHAVKALDRAAEQLRGMDQVFSCLKFSYDYLEKDQMRSALVFCAVYSEDYFYIDKAELIDYWAGEGLLDGDDVVNDGGIDDARRRGHDLINSLLDACLLEPGINGDAEHRVRLHDIVRDMMLWLNNRREEHDKVDRFLVIDYKKEHTATEVAKAEGQHVEGVKRIWMRHMEFSNFTSSYFPVPICSWTLLLNKARLGSLHLRGIFSRMTTLRVLDLSTSNIEEFLVEISLLGELRFLNLSWTDVKSLPRELGGLARLRQLVLRHTEKLESVPREAIAGFSNLQSLDMHGCPYDWGTHGNTSTSMEATSAIEGETNQQHSSSDAITDGAARGGGSRELLELGDLEGLDRLQELRIRLRSSHELRKLISASDKLCKCIKDLFITDDDDFPWVGRVMRFSLDRFPCMEDLTLFCFQHVGEWGPIMVTLEGATNPSSGSRNGAMASSSIPRLSRFTAWHYGGIKELTFTGRFPYLKAIVLFVDFGGMEEVVLEGDGEVRTGQGGESQKEQPRLEICCFPMLKVISLTDLPALKSVTVRRPPLHLPSLETLRVSKCP